MRKGTHERAYRLGAEVAEVRREKRMICRLHPSMHDNFITSYEVNCESREIKFHIQFRDLGTPYEYTTVVFSGVEAYSFEQDRFQNIILDIAEAKDDHWWNGRSGAGRRTSRSKWAPALFRS